MNRRIRALIWRLVEQPAQEHGEMHEIEQTVQSAFRLSEPIDDTSTCF
jgi:hypothetical protein